MRVLIVDDEAPARARLRRLLAASADLTIVGEAADAADALAQVDRQAPDVVLLDIHLPDGSGLDVAASLPEPQPLVVFVTAHDAHAVAAFDLCAIDYVLKPVAADRLQRALDRVRARRSAVLAPRADDAGPRTRPWPQRLLIADRGRTHVIPTGDITWLEAADNYVLVHAAGRAPLLRRTLTALVDDLGPTFLRTHKSAAVALAHVAAIEYTPGGKGDGRVRLRDGTRVPLSRTHRDALQARFDPAAAGDGPGA